MHPPFARGHVTLITDILKYVQTAGSQHCQSVAAGVKDIHL